MQARKADVLVKVGIQQVEICHKGCPAIILSSLASTFSCVIYFNSCAFLSHLLVRGAFLVSENCGGT
jgi:hypothetical protein